MSLETENVKNDRPRIRKNMLSVMKVIFVLMHLSCVGMSGRDGISLNTKVGYGMHSHRTFSATPTALFRRLCDTPNVRNSGCTQQYALGLVLLILVMFEDEWPYIFELAFF